MLLAPSFQGIPGSIRALLGRLGAVLLLACLSLPDAISSTAPGKITTRLETALSAGLDQGAPQDVLVVFESAGVAAQAKAQRQARHLAHDDSAIVRFKAQGYAAGKKALESSLALEKRDILRDYDYLPIQHVRVRSRAALAQLLAYPGVKSVSVSRPHKASLAESLPLISQPAALELGATGAGTSVAVLDTGVDFTNSAFGACVRPGPDCKVILAQDFAPNDNLPDASQHGTNVAGIVLGVAPQTRILALDVFRGGVGWTEDIVAAINWVVAKRSEYNIVAINMSLGDDTCDDLYPDNSGCKAPITDSGNAFKAAIDEARNAGVITAVATGNNGFVGAIDSPSAVDTAVSVGSVVDFGASVDTVSSFSNSASFMTLLAPGEVITAAGISMQGTSQATPHVAGAVAALRSLYPAETVNQIITRLKAGVPVTDSRNGIVKPRLNMLGAVSASNNPDSVQLVDQTGVAPGVFIESNPITISGLSGNASVSVSSPGWLSVNGDAWGNPTNVVTNGDVVRVHVTSAAAAGGSAGTTLTIGSLADTFTVTTGSSTVPAPQFDRAALAFGTVFAGSSFSQTATLSNGGNGTMLDVVVSIAGQGYSIGSNTCGSTLAAGANCVITAAYAPTMTGSHKGQLSVASSNAPGGTHVLPLVGTGSTPVALDAALDAAGRSFSTSGNASWFGQTASFVSGGSAAQSGRIVADQTSSLTTTVSGPGEGSFHWKVSSELGFDYLSFYMDGVKVEAISGTLDWRLKSFSVGAGTHTLTWTYAKDGFYSSGADAGWVDGFSFNSGQADASLTQSSHSFGSVNVGSSLSFTETLSNAHTATAPLLVSSVSVSGNGFSVTADTCSGTSVAAGSSCSVSVRFSPVEPGVASGSLSIVSNAPGSPLVAALDGTGAALSALGTGLDNGSLTFTTSTASPWFAQSMVTRVASNNTLQSGNPGALDTSWVETTVDGPGTLNFWWKVSSTGDTDFLVLMVDGQPAEAISGETGWVLRSLDVGSGSHTIRWSYARGARYPGGDDAAWLDAVSFVSAAAPANANLAVALDTPGMGWASANVPGGDAPWSGQALVFQNGGAAAASGTIGANQTSTLRTLLTGPGTLNFSWKVSSLTDHGKLCVTLDPSVAATDCISGEQGWAAKTLAIPAGVWPVVISYARDGAGAAGSDKGWVDGVSYTRSDVALPTALDATGLSFETSPMLPWYGQTAVSTAGGSAAQAGHILDNQRTWLTTAVTGPGILSFRWKVSSELLVPGDTADLLRFYVDGVESPLVAGISGEVDWMQHNLNIGAGIHTIGWQYAKDNYGSAASDTGWVDGISFGAAVAPGAPAIGTAVAGDGSAAVSFTVSTSDGGAPVTSYTATSAPGGITGSATSSPITVSGLTNGTAYTFTVTANNDVGSSLSSGPSNTVTPMGSQTVSFGATPSITVGGIGAVVATASSGLPVIYSTSSSACSVNASSGLVTGIQAGTNNCVVKADQAGNSAYHAAAQASQTLSIGKASQSISVATAAPATASYNASFTVAATASSGLGISYSSGTPSVCSNSGATFTMIAGSGSCTVQYDQAGDGNYNAATRVSNSVTAAKAAQTISFGTAPSLVYGGTGSVSASATSGLAVSYSSLTPLVCSITGSTLTVLSMGTCSIAADQSGNGNYSAASQVSQSVVVGKASQSISVATAAPATASYNASFTVAASASSGLAVSYSSGTPSVCTNSGATFTMVAGSGSCTVHYDQAGDGNYNAATRVSNSVTAAKAAQTVSFGTAPTLVYGGSGTVSASATSGLAVSYNSLTPLVCSITGSTLTVLSMGTCSIAADQSGNGNYSAASQVSQSVVVGKASQSISVATAAPTTAGYNGSFTVAATASSGLGISYSSGTPSICTNSGATFTMVAGSGSCTVHYDQAGDGNYNAATRVSNSVTAAKAAQTVSFGTAPTLVYGGTGTVSASATSGLAVSYSSLTPLVCSVSGNTLTVLTMGTCSIAADQAGNGNYSAASQVSQSVVVGKASQSISVATAAPATASYNASFTVAASASSGLAVSYSSGTSSVCSNSGATFTMVAGSGSCTVQYDQAGDGNYNAATRVSNSVTAAKAAQTVSFGTAPSLVYGGTGSVSASATSGLAVSYSSLTPLVCSITGNTLTVLTMGTCSIAADQSGNGNYSAASQVSQSVVVGKASQSISVGTAAPATAGYNGSFTVAASASSGLAVSYSSGTPSVCSNSGATFTMVAGSGSCTVQYDQGGDGNYNAASRVSNSVTAAKAAQTVSFGTAPSLVYGGTGTVSATSTSGLTVSYSSLTPLVCSITGSTLTVLSMGTCSIAADQAGNGNYSAASQASQSVVVGKASQSLTVGTAAPATAGYNASFTVAAMASSGLSVSYTSGTPSICTNSGATFTMVAGSGSCTVQYDQAGNGNYNAATRVSNSVTAAKAAQTVSFGTVPTLVYGGTGSVSASATSGLAVSYSSLTPLVCSVSGSTVTVLSMGTCSIAADQAGNGNYSAASQVSQSVVVGKASQSLTVGTAAPATAPYNGSFTVAATASSGLSVSYSSGTPSICTNSGATFTMVSGSGICTVQYDQTGDGNYSAASRVSNSVTAVKIVQIIGFDRPPTVIVGGTGSVSAWGGPSGNPLVLTSLTPGVCSISGSTVTGVRAGTCAVAANQAGNASYAPAPQATLNIFVWARAPGAPVISSVSTASASVTLGFTPPANDGGADIQGYTAVCVPTDNGTGLREYGTSSPLTLSGLATGVRYGCRVWAINVMGDGTPSAIVNVSVGRHLSSLTVSGPGSVDEGASASYSLVAAYDDGSSGTVSGSLSLASTTAASLSGLLLTGGAVTTDQVVSLSGSYTESGVSRVGGLAVTIRNVGINLVPGWNLIGNGMAAPWDVATLFGDASRVVSVFKWVPGTTPGWAFYTPTEADGGAAYAQSKGYSLLSTVRGGEGFWVNARTAFSIPPGSGAVVSSASFKDVLSGSNPLPAGWSLIAVGDNPSVRAFANALSLSGPEGSNPAATTLVSLWAWYAGDASQGQNPGWYFYAPSRDNDGSLADYIASRAYLDFLSTGKTLAPGDGFWVNRP